MSLILIIIYVCYILLMSLILIIVHVCYILLENQKNKTKQPGTGVALQTLHQTVKHPI